MRNLYVKIPVMSHLFHKQPQQKEIIVAIISIINLKKVILPRHILLQATGCDPAKLDLDGKPYSAQKGPKLLPILRSDPFFHGALFQTFL
jgi:hypothetical protein